MKTTKVICPKCGAEIAIAEHQHVTVGLVIGQDSNLGTVELPLADKGKKSKAQLRIDAMRAAGIDTRRFFCMKDENGNETMVAQQGADGSISVVSNDDPIINKIVEAGSLHNAHLFKQHVLAQVLKLMVHDHYDFETGHFYLQRDWNGNIEMSNYGTCVNNMSYGYSWDVLRDELKRQAAMYRHGDTKCLQEDQRWYNKQLVLDMFDYHHSFLVWYTKNAIRRRFKGNPYISINCADKLVPCKKSQPGYIFVSEIEPLLKKHADYRRAISKADDPIQLYAAVVKYMDAARPNHFSYRWSDVPRDLRKPITPCDQWKNAYKGYGGYFSMQNLILFHGCRISIVTDDRKIVKCSKDRSIEVLNNWADKHMKEGYWMIGALKQLILDNNFNIEKKQAEWRAKYN